MEIIAPALLIAGACVIPLVTGDYSRFTKLGIVSIMSALLLIVASETIIGIGNIALPIIGVLTAVGLVALVREISISRKPA